MVDKCSLFLEEVSLCVELLGDVMVPDLVLSRLAIRSGLVLCVVLAHFGLEALKLRELLGWRHPRFQLLY